MREKADGLAHLSPQSGVEAAIRALAGAFAAAGVDDAGSAARLLVLAAAQIDRAELARNPERPIGAARELILQWAARRLRREPVSRILGRREFWGVDLEISSDVLDPRPDTEIVVEAALAAGVDRDHPIRVLDLGLGSGALLCALLSELPLAWGVGVDLSPQACVIARRNLERLGLSRRSEVVQGNWDRAGGGPFDLVVSNPPYIPTSEIATLDPEVRIYDPRLALDGGADGLAAYRAIGRVLPNLLAVGGTAVFEVGFGQGAGVAAVLGGFGVGAGSVRSDLAGRERALVCRLL